MQSNIDRYRYINSDLLEQFMSRTCGSCSLFMKKSPGGGYRRGKTSVDKVLDFAAEGLGSIDMSGLNRKKVIFAMKLSLQR